MAVYLVHETVRIKYATPNISYEVYHVTHFVPSILIACFEKVAVVQPGSIKQSNFISLQSSRVIKELADAKKELGEKLCANPQDPSVNDTIEKGKTDLEIIQEANGTSNDGGNKAYSDGEMQLPSTESYDHVESGVANVQPKRVSQELTDVQLGKLPLPPNAEELDQKKGSLEIKADILKEIIEGLETGNPIQAEVVMQIIEGLQ